MKLTNNKQSIMILAKIVKYLIDNSMKLPEGGYDMLTQLSNEGSVKIFEGSDYNFNTPER